MVPPASHGGTVPAIDQVDHDIYQEEVKEYVKKHSKLQTHNQQLYTIIYGQIAQLVQSMVKSHTTYAAIQQQPDGIRLLNEVQAVMLNVQEQQYLPLMIHQTK